MPYFFRQAVGILEKGPLPSLETQKIRFRNSQTSGLIEIETGPASQIAITVARGAVAGVFAIQGDASRPILLADIPNYWLQPELPIRSVTLPDTAARLLWLALDAQISERLEIQDENQWNAWLTGIHARQTDALAALCSAECDGFVYIHNGKPLAAESVFATARGVETGIPLAKIRGPWQVQLHIPNPQAQAWQCLCLRLGAGRWFANIQSRYQEIVGQRLVRFMNIKLQAVVKPWNWEIKPESNTFVDRHFFPQLNLAAEAYRTLFMDIGEHIGTVVGDRLTQRLLSETFDNLHHEQRSVLENQRLIPAAFSG